MAGDSGPYLQYAYARSQHILEKSCQYFSTPKFDLLVTEQEVDVIKEIAKFDLVVQEAIKTLNPKLLARYAYRLATSFNLFYEKTPVLKEWNKEVMNARLALVKAFGMTLRNVLNVLGIAPLNQM
jgi:arginyl-tRNA synthetase